MNIYIIFTTDTEDSVITIKYGRDIFSSKEQAFAVARVIGEKASVLELKETYIWDYDQMQEEILKENQD